MMTLSELMTEFPPKEHSNVSADVQIEYLTHRSEYCQHNSAFVLFSEKNNIPQNAPLLLSEKPIQTSLPQLNYEHFSETVHSISYHLTKPYIKQLDLIGITGTNGKSTCVSMYRSLKESLCRLNIGSLGTLGFKSKNYNMSTFNTTPFPLDLHYTLKQAVQHGVKEIAMEVSSHSLDQKRIKNLSFNQIAFTNITQDHLDYHKTLNKYISAKEKIFNYSQNPAIINADCPNLKKVIKNRVTFSYSTQFVDADLFATILVENEIGIEGEIHYQNKLYSFSLPCFGKHNLENCLCVTALLLNQGYPLQDIVNNYKYIQLPKGRLEKLGTYPIFIDYAHTPDALKQSLETLRKHFKSHSITTVFGCGGDRDKSKRSKMGAIAEQLSEKVILTNDNPRTESPKAIIENIQSGMKHKKEWVCEDREEAIKKAVTTMNKDTLLLVAGKGHEEYQEIMQRKKPFSDHKICLENV